MKDKNFYTNAHLVVSAIRILEHRDTVPPSINEVCRILSFSPEQGNLICRKLADMEIINWVEGAHGTRLFVKNHLKIEEIPKETRESRLDEELKKFKHTKKEYSKKIKSLQTDEKQRKKNLFAEIEQQLKSGLKNK